MEKALDVYGAAKRLVLKYGLSAVTVRCFDLLTTVHTTGCLALAILNCPDVLRFTSVKTCDLVKTEAGFRVVVTRRVNEPMQKTRLAPGEKIVKQMCNHNNVMVKDKLKVMNPDGREAIDGLKTGYIDAGGSSVVMTGSRNGKRAIAIILGSASSQDRDANAARLMSDALGALSW